jgi:AraC-like DNA-binding protein
VFALAEKDGQALFTQRFAGYPRGIARHAHEYALASVVTHARRQVSAQFAPAAVWFIHARPKHVGELRRFFGTGQIEFGREENGLSFPASLLDATLSTADPRLLATAEDLAEAALREAPPPSDFVASVDARVREVLPNGPPDAAEIARRMHMSRRTLQRRLSEAGTGFQELVDRVRADLARGYMRDPRIKLADVAYRLGFSDVSTFSRSFKRWTGESPGRYALSLTGTR